MIVIIIIVLVLSQILFYSKEESDVEIIENIEEDKADEEIVKKCLTPIKIPLDMYTEKSVIP